MTVPLGCVAFFAIYTVAYFKTKKYRRSPQKLLSIVSSDDKQ
jgi:hypothetical protein